ncbi:pyridoxamine 5'-phosphate oxidase family protein [Actinomycetota bacterium]
MTTQRPDAQLTSDPKEVDKVHKLIDDADIAMLTTHDASDPEGNLVSRPLSTQRAEDGDALFLVRASSAVAQDIAADPRVNVSYSTKSAWVSVAGRGEIVTDPALTKELWSRGAAMFMEGGPENPDNVVLKVHGETAEYWGGESLVATAVKSAKAIAGRDHNETTTVVDLT